MEEFRLVYSKGYDSGKIITSVMRGNDLVSVVVSENADCIIEGFPAWKSYIYDYEKGAVDSVYHGYAVNPLKDIVETEKEGKLLKLTRQHENIVTVLMKYLMCIPSGETLH